MTFSTSPQTENGYIRISNEFWEALCRTRIPGEERQVLDAILRKTWGFNKKSDAIPLSQFEAVTGLDRANICRSIKKLKNKRLISVKNDTGKVTIYGINKVYSQWLPVSKVTRVNIDSVKSDNLPVSEVTHSKDILSKDNNKCFSKSLFPICETWKAFVEMRKRKAPLTSHASMLVVKKLTELKAQGHDPIAVLEQSILNGWRGVFPLKDKKQETLSIPAEIPSYMTDPAFDDLSRRHFEGQAQ